MLIDHCRHDDFLNVVWFLMVLNMHLQQTSKNAKVALHNSSGTRYSIIKYLFPVVVQLPALFRRMGAQRNSAKTQQSGHTPRSGPEVKIGRSSAKKARQRSSDAENQDSEIRSSLLIVQ